VQVGYPDVAVAAPEIVRRQLQRHPLQDLRAVMGPEEVLHAQTVVRDVHVDDSVLEYVVALVQATRAAPELTLGASPRSMVALTRCSQARAVAKGRDYVLPDDVKALASAALAHRLIPRQSRAGAGIGREVVRRILTEVPVPLHAAPRS